MRLIHFRRATRRVKFAGVILGSVMTLGAATAWAQTAPAIPAATKPCPDVANRPRPGSGPVQTFHLSNVGQQQDANELLTVLRNILDPGIKITLMASQNDIVIEGPAEQLALAQRLITELDRPKKTYRLTYTVTERDGSKRVDGQHFTMIVVAGQRGLLKQGSKVPVVAGTYKPEVGPETQITYLDVGMTFDAILNEYGNAAILRTKVEQSSVADEKSGLGPQDPLLRQASLESTSTLVPGKAAMIGSLDIPGSTRHLDVV